MGVNSAVAIGFIVGVMPGTAFAIWSTFSWSRLHSECSESWHALCKQHDSENHAYIAELHERLGDAEHRYNELLFKNLRDAIKEPA